MAKYTDMDTNNPVATKATEVTKLAQVENISDQYLKELQTKIIDLRQKVNEGKLIYSQLQDLGFNLQGKIQVVCQRTAELGMEQFQEVLAQAKEEIQNAKMESMKMDREIFAASKDMVFDLDKSTLEINSLKVLLKNSSTIGDHSKEIVEDHQQLQTCLNEMDSNTEKIESAKAETTNWLENLPLVNSLIDSQGQDRGEMEREISGLSMKLHVSRSSGSC